MAFCWHAYEDNHIKTRFLVHALMRPALLYMCAHFAHIELSIWEPASVENSCLRSVA